MSHLQGAMKSAIFGIDDSVELLQSISPRLVHSLGALLQLFETHGTTLALAQVHFTLKFLQITAMHAKMIQLLPAEIFQELQ